MSLTERISNFFYFFRNMDSNFAFNFGVPFAFIFSLFIYIAYTHYRSRKAALDCYRRLPDLPTYLAINKGCQSPNGPKCKHCQSHSFGSYSVGSALNNVFVGNVHYCRKCQNNLYIT